MSSTNASSSTSSRSSNGVTMAVMTDPMPGTGAIIPHVVEVEARDDVRVVVDDGPWPVDPALRAGGAAHLAALRRRVPAMHDGPVLAMTSRRAAASCARAGRATSTWWPPPTRWPAIPRCARGRRRVAGGDPLRRGDGRVAALGLSVAATLPGGRVLLGRRRAELPLDPGAWHVVPSGMLEPDPDPIAAAVAREALEELGVAVDPGAVRMLGLGWDLARLRPEVCVALALEAAPARAGGDEFDVVEAFEVARPPAPLTAGAPARWRCSGRNARGAGPDVHEHRRRARGLADAGRFPGAEPGRRTRELVLTRTRGWRAASGRSRRRLRRRARRVCRVHALRRRRGHDHRGRRAVHEVRPGVALTVPPGWRGRWEVRETVRKTYVIVRDRA